MTQATYNKAGLGNKRVRAEAALMVTRLHGPTRGPELEAAARRWQETSPEHRRAFERAMEVWDKTANLGFVLPRSPPRELAPRTMLLAALCSLFLVCAAYWMHVRAQGMSTAIGEQRVLMLSDGSEAQLNTDSRILVEFSKRERRVTLARGEAYFNVAKQADRPFVVVVAGRTITATGTEFMVRKVDTAHAPLIVTLIKGNVLVTHKGVSGSEETLPMGTGQRVIFRLGQEPVLDNTPLSAVTSWRRGLLMFEDTSIRKAIEEVNRYSRQKILLEAPAGIDLPVNGLFRIGDLASFARAIRDSNAKHLTLLDDGKKFILEYNAGEKESFHP